MILNYCFLSYLRAQRRNIQFDVNNKKIQIQFKNMLCILISSIIQTSPLLPFMYYYTYAVLTTDELQFEEKKALEY